MTPLRIAVHLTDNKPDAWVEGLRAALPGAQVEVWSPGMAATFDHAVVWAPPQQLVDEQPQVRGLFNIGAGVDALLALKLPPAMRIVRIDDGGMAVQMAEYVCHALIRHFREFDVYEADAREGRWSFRKPLARVDFPVGIMGLGVLGERTSTFRSTAGADRPRPSTACGRSRGRHSSMRSSPRAVCWSTCCR
jgi:glyoxylate/hydroxypyruvate reductase A